MDSQPTDKTAADTLNAVARSDDLLADLAQRKKNAAKPMAAR